VLALIAKALSFAKDLFLARSFGTGDELDAFLIAFALPSFAINVIAGSFNVALIPTFVRVRETGGRELAQNLLSSVSACGLAVLSVAALTFALSSDWLLSWLASGFPPEKLALSRFLFLLLLPVIVVTGVGTSWGAVLNAEKRFTLPAIAPAITPCLTILGFALFSSYGVKAVAVATVIGLTTEAALLGWGLMRAGYSCLPVWPDSPALKEVISQYFPLAFGAILMSGTTIVDQAMAATLGPGSVSALAYGGKLVILIITLGSMAIGTAILPHFSEMIAAGNWPGVRHSLRTYCRVAFLASLPVAIVMIVWAEEIVRLLFERGTFTSEDTKVVATVAAFMGKSRQIFLISAANLLVNVIADYVLIQYLGVAGIGLSTTLVYFCSCTLIFIVVSKTLKEKRISSEHPNL
jgi:putative peptidoglycan lipid II flippase